MKKFAVFDIDGTLIRWQLYHALVDRLAKNSHLSQGAQQTINQARLLWKRRIGKESFRQYEITVVQEFEKVLLKIDTKALDQAANEAVNEHQDQAYTFTRDLLKNLKQQDYLIFAISGSHKELVGQLSRHYGFDDFLATEYVRENGKFTGEKIFPTQDKKVALESLVKKHGCSYSQSYAVGDSIGDAPMLMAVENPIAFNPDQNLHQIAVEKGWQIVVERKNVVYKLNRNGNRYQLEY